MLPAADRSRPEGSSRTAVSCRSTSRAAPAPALSITIRLAGDVEGSLDSMKEIQNRSRACRQHRLHQQLAFPSNTAAEIVSRWTSRPMYLTLFIRVFLSSGVVDCSSHQPQPTSKGAPFYNAWPTLVIVAESGCPTLRGFRRVGSDNRDNLVKPLPSWTGP